MSALTSPVLINQNRAYWLSSIQNDVVHSTIACREIDADLARFSTVYVSDFLTTSTLNASSFTLTNLDLSNAEISTLRTNNAFTSSLTWASDLSGGSGSVFITTDPSGVKVSGDPIVFADLVYFTSTINLVPVSTIVDTDIFSSNAYFSTMSSGTVSTGALQTSSLLAYNAFMSTLTVSSITAGDISGFSPSLWSLYPTLNSSVTFSGGNVLSNVGNKIFFAGTELTDVSGGGQDWSNFPATTDVSMNNFSIRALSTLQYQDGARLYSQTGNNLFYNGQPISYGIPGNASNWSLFPAKTDVQAGSSTITTSNIQINGSNITNGNTFTNSLGVGGTSLVPIASITSGGDLSCRNIEVGDNVTSVADVNIYGANAVPGDNALYVQGGVQFDGGTIHGFSAGVIPVAGINTGRIDMLQAGFNLLHPLVGAITTGTAMSLTAGGAMSLAAGGYIETNTSTIQCINTSQGNKNTTLQTGFLTIDPDLAPTSSIKLFNVLGGGVEIDGGGQGSLQGFSTVQSQFLSSLSTLANSSRINLATTSTTLWNYALGISTQTNNLRANRIEVVNDISGISAGGPILSRIRGFSTINSFNVSTTDLWVSSINGQPIDISGNPFVNTNNFSTLKTSTIQVSSITIPPGQQAITVQNPLRFATQGTIENIFQLNTDQLLDVTINANKIFTNAFNMNIQSISTQRISGNIGKFSTLQGPPATGLDISGSLNMVAGNITLPQNNVINFTAGGSLGTNNLINTTVPCITNGGPSGCNLGAVAANQFLIGSGTGAFGAAKLYCDFPGDNWGVDIIDANGTTLFETINCYDTAGFNFQTNLYGVSSIVGYTANIPGSQQAVGIQGIITAPALSTTQIQYTSSIVWSQSNANFWYPLSLDYDGAGSNTGGVAIRVMGHSLGTGAVRNELHMGYRASDGANYIQSVWPGLNLEDLYIEGEPVTITDGSISTIFNSQPFAMKTAGGVQVGVGSGVVEISTNLLKVGGQTNLTGTTISTTFLNLPYGNEFYMAGGPRQPHIQFGTVATSGGSGNQQVQIATPYYDNSNFVVQATMRDTNTAQMSAQPDSISSFTLYWSNGGGGSHSIDWTTFGNLPFTG